MLVCNAVLFGFAGNVVACCVFLCFSASSFRCAFVLWYGQAFMVVAQFECVCRSTALELRSAIKVYVLFCEQFNGHVVNGVDLHFKYDGLK